MSLNRIVVIKVGGSLIFWKEFPRRLREYLDEVRTETERFVLIVGGGRAADLVRELDSVHSIGEKRSHGLALRVLDMTARMVASLVPDLIVVERPDELASVWESGRVPVFAPRWFLEKIDAVSAQPLAESWEVTTDSIAARVAVFLGAHELRLLKSAGAGGVTSRAEAARSGLVDPAFPGVSASIERLNVVNLKGNPPTTEPLI